jgi:hypothetical protein
MEVEKDSSNESLFIIGPGKLQSHASNIFLARAPPHLPSPKEHCLV